MWLISKRVTPWGALPYHQAHFVVICNGKNITERLLARTRKRTKGIIHKEIIDVWWEGGSIADQLNQDIELKSLLKEILLEEGDIYLDPTENCVRIHSSWKADQKYKINNISIQVYNIIARHLNKFIKSEEI